MTAGSVTHNSATLTLTGHVGNWWLKRTSPADATCKAMSTATTENLSGMTPGSAYTYKAYSDSSCSTEIAEETFTTLASLAVSRITATGARLTIAGHSGQWWYKATARPHATCQGPVAANTADKDLTGLAPVTSYTYSAYDKSGCAAADLLRTASAFTTDGVSVSNLSETAALTSCSAGRANDSVLQQCATGFTTGSAAQGYKLHSVTVTFNNTQGSPTGFGLALHAASGGNPASAAVPNSTLTGATSPTAAGQQTYTCSGAGCDLGKGATYFIVMTAPTSPSNTLFRWSVTASDNETVAPPGNGWVIDNSGREGDEWRSIAATGRMKVAASVNPTLNATGITGTGATLNVADYLGAWWYKRTAGTPADSTCHSVAAGTASATVSGLNEHADYTYTAYDKTGCGSADAMDSVSFHTGADTLTSGSVTQNSAILTLGGHTGPWYVKRITPAGDSTCKTRTSTQTTESLTSLAENSVYVYAAYNDASCSHEIARETFTTRGIWASAVDATTVTLNIGGYTGSWYYKANKAPHTACQSIVTGTYKGLTGLDADTGYVYTAYSDASCSASKLLATAAFRTAVTASNLSRASNGQFTIAGSDNKGATQFTTGSSPGGYTLHSVTLDMLAVTGSPGDLAVTIHSDSSNEPGSKVATLSGGNPATAGQYVFTCSSNCALDKSAKYYAVLAASGGSTGNQYNWTKAELEENDETLLPANNGWLLGSGYHSITQNSWSTEGSVGRMKVVAVANPSLTATGLGATTATLNLGSYTGGAWWHQRTAGTPADAVCRSVAAGTATASLTGLTEHNDYTHKAYDKTGCAARDEIASVTFTPTDDTLTVSKITETTATLTLAGHSGNWWLKRVTPADTNCKSKNKTFTENLTQLTAGTVYAYRAYEASGCADADEIVRVGFTTLGPVTVSNLTGGTDDTLRVGHAFGGPYKSSTAFRTGSNGGGYELDSVKIQLSAPKNNPTGGLTAKLYTSNITDTGDLEHGGNPTTLVKNMGTKANAGASAGKVTWDCDCDLQANTVYHVVLEVGAVSSTGSYYHWTNTTSDDEAVVPASEGCEIANEARTSKVAGVWYSGGNRAGRFELTVNVKPTLTATGVTHTAATLNLSRHGAAWWYKRTAGTPADATCRSVASGTATASLSGLTEHTSYTYKAYDKTGCGSADAIATVTFHTGADTLTAGGITDGKATLTLSGHSAAWYVQRVTPAGDSACKAKTSAQTTESLTGLRPGTRYVYAAHNNSTCTHEIARETFTTLELFASGMDATKVTLNLGNHTGSWYYKADKAPHNTCQSDVVTRTSKALTGLSADTGYVYTAYSNSICSSASLLATGPFRTPVTASNLTNSSNGSIIIAGTQKGATQFTTGSSSGGYTLHSVTLDMLAVTGSPGDLTVAIHSDSSDKPGSLVATLSGSNPATAGQYVFTCSSNCALDKSAKYYVVLTASGGSTGNTYDWTKAELAVNDETLSPANNGWVLGSGYHNISQNTWSTEGSVGRMKVAAVANPYLTAGSFTDTTASLGLASYTGAAWWHKRTAPSGSNACTMVAAGTASVTLSSLTEHDSYTYKAYDWPGCASGDEVASLTFVPTNDVMTSSKVTETTAKLTLTGHTGNWWLKQTKPSKSDAACDPRGKVGTVSLTGLTASTGYAYAAYDASGCADADKIASASFLTAGPLTVGNLTGGTDSANAVGHAFGGPYKSSTAFRTGKNTLGYTLDSVKIQLSAPVGSPAGGLTAKLYTATGAETGALVTGGNPNTLVKDMGTKASPGTGPVTWSCDCDLQANTVYHVVLEVGASNTSGYYRWTNTTSDDQAVTPASEGWEIANEPRRSRVVQGNYTWYSGGSRAGRFELTVKEKGTAFIAASNVTANTATLNVHHHTAAWWYQRTSPAGDATCHSVTAGTTADSLTGLTPGVTYTYKAYTASGCNDTSKEIGDETFTAAGESVSNLGETAHNQSCYVGAGIPIQGRHLYECAMSFTTGSASGEYAMQKARVNIRNVHGSPGNIRVTLHADDSSKPASTALATLSGSNPTARGEYDFTCANCYLAPNTTYWLVLAAPNANTSANNMYTWNLTSSSSETPGPSGSGWTIADNYKYRGASGGAHCHNDWCTPAGTARPAMFQVAATINPVGPPQDVLVGKPPDWSEAGKVKHTVTWSKPSGGTGSFSYELQCTVQNNPSASQWTNCGTHTVAATSDTSISLVVSQGNTYTLKMMRVRAKQNGVYSRWIEADTYYKGV